MKSVYAGDVGDMQKPQRTVLRAKNVKNAAETLQRGIGRQCNYLSQTKHSGQLRSAFSGQTSSALCTQRAYVQRPASSGCLATITASRAPFHSLFLFVIVREKEQTQCEKSFRTRCSFRGKQKQTQCSYSIKFSNINAGLNCASKESEIKRKRWSGLIDKSDSDRQNTAERDAFSRTRR